MSETNRKYAVYRHDHVYGDNSYDSGYQLDAYLSSYNWADTHDYDQLSTNGRHRWNLQCYFSDPPDYDQNHKDNYKHYVNEIESNFKFEWDWRNDGENANVTHSAWEPTESDPELDWSISVGPTIGPVSAGMSYTYNDAGPDIVSDPHNYIEWTIPEYSLPTGQDDTSGVYLDVVTGGNRRTEDIWVDTEYSWEYWDRYANTHSYTTVYSTSASVDWWVRPEVV